MNHGRLDLVSQKTIYLRDTDKGGSSKPAEDGFGAPGPSQGVDRPRLAGV
jgi:hypothetical protein